MHFLGLLRGSDFPGADSPYRFISNDDLGPVFYLIGDGFKLRGDYLDGLIAFPLLWSGQSRANQWPLDLAYLQCLSAAQDDTQSSVKRCLGLTCDKLNHGYQSAPKF